jgi:hypothetical protein
MNASAPDVHVAKMRLLRELGQIEERIQLAEDAGDAAWRAELVAESRALREKLEELRAAMSRKP